MELEVVDFISPLKLTVLEEEQVLLISEAFDVFSKTLLCRQKKAHFYHLKYLLENIAKDGHNLTKSIGFVLGFIKAKITADRLAYLVGALVNTFGVSNEKVLGVQRTVMKEFGHRYEMHNRSPHEIWYECQFVQSKLNELMDSMSKEYKMLRKELLTRREEIKRRRRADGISTKVIFPKSAHGDKPCPPFSEQVLSRKQQAFAKIVSATQALLLSEESSAHYLFASLVVEAIFVGSTKGHELCQSTKCRKDASNDCCLDKFEKLAFDYSSCLERIFSTLNIHEMMTVYLRSSYSRDASRIQELTVGIGERLRANGTKNDFVTSGGGSFRASPNDHDVCNVAYEAYITLLNTFRKAECLLHKRNVEAVRLNYLIGKLELNSSARVKMLNKIQVPTVLADVGIFWTSEKILNELEDSNPSVSSPNSNVDNSENVAPNTGCLQTNSSEQHIEGHGFFALSNLRNDSQVEMVKEICFGGLPDPSLLYQEEADNQYPGRDFINDGLDFADVDRLLTMTEVVGGYGTHYGQGPGGVLCEQQTVSSTQKQDAVLSNFSEHVLKQELERKSIGSDQKKSGAEELAAIHHPPSSSCYKLRSHGLCRKQSASTARTTRGTGSTDGVNMFENAFTSLGSESNLKQNKATAQQVHLTPSSLQSTEGIQGRIGGERQGLQFGELSPEGPVIESALWLKAQTIDAAIAQSTLSTLDTQVLPLKKIGITDKAFVPLDAVPHFTLDEIAEIGEHLSATKAMPPHGEERDDMARKTEIQGVFLEEESAGGAHGRAESVIDLAEINVTTVQNATSILKKNADDKAFSRDLMGRLNERALNDTGDAPSSETIVSDETSEQRKEMRMKHWDKMPDDLFSEQCAAIDAGYGLSAEEVLELPFDADSLLSSEL